MSMTTVSKLATALKIKPEKLISQLKDAGISVSAESDTITNDQKLTLLNVEKIYFSTQRCRNYCFY